MKKEKNILVTGGAGYIGSVVVEKLIANGYSVIVIDDLRDGNQTAVPTNIPFYKSDFANETVLEEIFLNYEISTVMHFAGSANVPLSVKQPSEFYHNNVISSITLLNTMVKNNISKIIFSSTAAVYGEPLYAPIDENHPLNPINPYGNSKLMVENILADYAKAYDLKYVILRYFCAAGATKSNGESRKSKETHLIPLVADKVISPEIVLSVFGNDFPTRDGSGIRDYVHVKDIAAAHIDALENIDKYPNSVYNIGTKAGYSVFEVIKEAESIFDTRIKYRLSERRPGDPANLTSSYEKIYKELGWRPKFSLSHMLISALEWRKNPKY